MNKIIWIVGGALMIFAAGAGYIFLSTQNTVTQAVSTTTENPKANTDASLAQPPVLGEVYTDSSRGFSIRPPANWHVDASGRGGTVVLFTTKEDNVLIAVSVEAASDFAANVQDWFVGYRNYEVSKDPLTKFISQKTMKVSGNDAVAYVVQDQNPTQQTNTIVTIKSGRMYSTIGSAPLQKWNTYASVIEASLATLELR